MCVPVPAKEDRKAALLPLDQQAHTTARGRNVKLLKSTRNSESGMEASFSRQEREWVS